MEMNQALWVKGRSNVYEAGFVGYEPGAVGMGQDLWVGSRLCGYEAGTRQALWGMK